MKTKTWQVYSSPIGQPGSSFYRPAGVYGTVQAPSKMKALDAVAEKFDGNHVGGNHQVAVLGLGYLKVRPATPT